jgi:nitrogen-specific signal transduction histidine kinase
MTYAPPKTKRDLPFLQDLVKAERDDIERAIWLSHIATTLAHELGNPLQSIRGCLDLSLEDSDLSAESRAYLDMACAEIDRLSALLIRLRELYTTQAPERSEVHLDALLNADDS